MITLVLKGLKQSLRVSVGLTTGLNDYPGSKGIETSQKRKPARAIACLNDYPGHKGAETR